MIWKQNFSILFAIITTFSASNIQAQQFSQNSLNLGFGLAINEGIQETGMGVAYSVAYQRELWKNRIRISAGITNGGFFPFAITDVRDQYFRISCYEIKAAFDIIKIKSFSIYVGGGGFFDYSRGLLGTGGWPEAGNTQSEYFFKIYYGGLINAGIRFDPPNKKLAIEFSPFNFHFGNNYFMLALIKINMNIKFMK